MNLGDLFNQFGAIDKIFFLILLLSCFIIFGNAIYDFFKKRKINGSHFISFIIPTYNDGKYIENTLKSIHSLYKKNNIEVIIINDCSRDRTLEILKKLKKTYKFVLINNKKNLGKTTSVNSAFKLCKGDIVIIVDSDMHVSKEALNDILARFNEDEKVGGVSCRYKVKNLDGILAKMQDIEYNMLFFLNSANNLDLRAYLTGGFMAFRKEAFKDIKGLSINCLTEDLDAALKLNETGWKVKQSYVPVYTHVPENFKDYYKQKIRWTGGLMQGLIDHPKVSLKNPTATLYMLSYFYFMFTFVISLIIGIVQIRNFYLESFLFYIIKNASIYFVFTIPYFTFYKDYRFNLFKYFLIIPYCLVYFPIFVFITAIGFWKAIYTFDNYKRATELGKARNLFIFDSNLILFLLEEYIRIKI